MKQIILISFLLLLTVLPVFAQQKERVWTTVKDISSNRTLRLHWVGVYEGKDTVYSVEVIQDKKTIKSFKISGQPVFNKNNDRVAFPNCWDGGCEKAIRILDLSNLSELQPLLFDKESFLTVAWVSDRRLHVTLGAMSEKDRTEFKDFDFK